MSKIDDQPLSYSSKLGSSYTKLPLEILTGLLKVIIQLKIKAREHSAFIDHPQTAEHCTLEILWQKVVIRSSPFFTNAVQPAHPVEYKHLIYKEKVHNHLKDNWTITLSSLLRILLNVSAQQFCATSKNKLQQSKLIKENTMRLRSTDTDTGQGSSKKMWTRTRLGTQQN